MLRQPIIKEKLMKLKQIIFTGLLALGMSDAALAVKGVTTDSDLKNLMKLHGPQNDLSSVCGTIKSFIDASDASPTEKNANYGNEFLNFLKTFNGRTYLSINPKGQPQVNYINNNFATFGFDIDISFHTLSATRTFNLCAINYMKSDIAYLQTVQKEILEGKYPSILKVLQDSELKLQWNQQVIQKAQDLEKQTNILNEENLAMQKTMMDLNQKITHLNQQREEVKEIFAKNLSEQEQKFQKMINDMQNNHIREIQDLNQKFASGQQRSRQQQCGSEECGNNNNNDNNNESKVDRCISLLKKELALVDKYDPSKSYCQDGYSKKDHKEFIAQQMRNIKNDNDNDNYTLLAMSQILKDAEKTPGDDCNSQKSCGEQSQHKDLENQIQKLEEELQRQALEYKKDIKNTLDGKSIEMEAMQKAYEQKIYEMEDYYQEKIGTLENNLKETIIKQQMKNKAIKELLDQE